MSYSSRVRHEYACPNGIRRVEFCYCGDIDPLSGRVIWKRCIGKSFLDKSAKTEACLALEAPERSA